MTRRHTIEAKVVPLYLWASLPIQRVRAFRNIGACFAPVTVYLLWLWDQRGVQWLLVFVVYGWLFQVYQIEGSDGVYSGVLWYVIADGLWQICMFDALRKS